MGAGDGLDAPLGEFVELERLDPDGVGFAHGMRCAASLMER